jgi:hypothetical protein
MLFTMCGWQLLKVLNGRLMHIADVLCTLLLLLPQGEYIAVEKLEAIYKKSPSTEQVGRDTFQLRMWLIEGCCSVCRVQAGAFRRERAGGSSAQTGAGSRMLLLEACTMRLGSWRTLIAATVKLLSNNFPCVHHMLDILSTPTLLFVA